MSPSAYQRAGPRLCALVLGLIALAACQGFLQPLADPGARPGQGTEGGRAVLVRLAACWAATPLAEELVAAYTADSTTVSFDLVSTDSQTARELVAAGQADLALVEESLSARDASRPPDAPVLALNAIGIIVPKDSPLRDLSTAQLAALFAGQRLDWDELKAGQGPIELVSFERGAFARQLFERVIMGDLALGTTAILMPHDRGIVDYVAQHPGAIGYVSTAYVDERVRLVAVDGILPAADEVRRARYPLVDTLVALAAPNAPPEVGRLVAFATGSKGQRIIAQRYVLPR